MPFTDSDYHRATNQLNFALYRSMPFLATAATSQVYTYDSQLDPATYFSNLPIPRVFTLGVITARMSAIAIEYTITQIQAVLTDLEALDTKISTEQSSANSSLIKADSLEWQPGLRTQGMITRRDENIERLRYFLGLPPTPSLSGSSGMLERS